MKRMVVRVKCAIGRFVSEVYRCWKEEYRVVFGSIEMMVFFFLLPCAYPILYALIYNPEEVREVPVVVVDNDGSELSRTLVNDFDATPAASVVGYCSDASEARRYMMQRRCYALLVIPEGFDRDVIRGDEQSTVVFYIDMSLLLNYKTLYMALTDVTMALGGKIRQERLPIGVSQSLTDIVSNPIPYASVVMFNPTSGLASFLIPAVLILILQQSVILGLSVRAGRACEKKEPLFTPQDIMAQMCGRAICYLSLYLINVVYLTHFIPWLFHYPMMGNSYAIIVFTFPMVVASIFMAMSLSMLVREQEDGYMMFVFTSVMMLFLSGIAWPRYAMPLAWKCVSSLLPSTWGIKGYIQMSTMGATLSQASESYAMLWVLSLFYFILTYVLLKLRQRKH